MKNTVHISLPVPEKISTNRIYAGLHWSERNRLKDLYHWSIKPFWKTKINVFPVVIRYEFEWSGRTLDTTNCTFMSKLLEDGLINAKIIPDDAPEYVSETRISSKKGKKDWVTIYICNRTSSSTA